MALSPEQKLDRQFMMRALSLAKRAWGRTAPNPMVGAVVVKNGSIVGEGYHHRAGTPHAEVHALRAAGADAQGAAIYVTLEPCSTYGRTPPCCEAIKSAGIKRVVAAVTDPNPRHAGKGFELLRQAGIEVEVGVCEAEARELNKAFFKLITTGKPYVLLKMAMTLDGKIATAGGDSKWITSAAARQRVQKLRQWADAIMVGGETVRLDRPGLVVRSPKNWAQQPQKLIYTKMDAQTLHQQYFPDDDTVRAAAPDTPEKWEDFLLELGKEDIGALLLEGGGELAGIALQNRIVDEVEFHIAPKLLGGRNSRTVVGGENPVKLLEAQELSDIEIRRAGVDVIISGKVKY